MSLNQRRLVFALLVGLMFFDAVALNPVGQELQRTPWEWTRFWWGSLLAQVCLLGTWAALGRSPWVDRLPAFLGLACLYGLVLQGVASHYPTFSPAMAQGIAVAMPALFATLVLVLLLLRRLLRWKLVLGGEAETSPPRSAQLTIRHLFLWLTGTALFLGLAVWILGVPRDGTVAMALPATAAALGTGALVAAFALPMLIACLGLTLAEHHRGRFALALVVVLLGLPVVFLGMPLLQLRASINWLRWLGPLARVGSIELGFVGIFCGVLALARLCGYRLQRGHATAGSPFQPRPRFAWVVGLLVLAFLLLCWPAAREHQVRRTVAACQEWQKTGLYATYEELGEIILFVEPDKPMSQAAHDRMAVPEYAAQVIGVNLVTASSGDLQLPSLAKLQHLRWLNLANTDLTDAGLEHLQGLKELRSVDLTRTHVTPEGVAKLQAALPDCRIVTASPASPPP